MEEEPLSQTFVCLCSIPGCGIAVISRPGGVIESVLGEKEVIFPIYLCEKHKVFLSTERMHLVHCASCGMNFFLYVNNETEEQKFEPILVGNECPRCRPEITQPNLLNLSTFMRKADGRNTDSCI